MSRTMISSLLVFGMALSLLLGAGCRSTIQVHSIDASDTKTHKAVTGVHRFRGWAARHYAISERLEQGNVDLLFIGDSITHSWEKNGKEVWQEYYGHRNAANFGIGGDRTEHVLWRLDHAPIDRISPRVAVLLIGTNNSKGDDYTAEEIADGIIAICAKLRQKLPRTRILLLAIFPRGETPSPQRQKNARASAIASEIADGRMVHTLDIGDAFLGPDKTLSKEIMPDFLHLTPAGYKIWADAIEPKLSELMGDKKHR